MKQGQEGPRNNEELKAQRFIALTKETEVAQCTYQALRIKDNNNKDNNRVSVYI